MIRGCLPALAGVAALLVAPAAAGGAVRERDCDGVPCLRLSVPLDRSGVVPGRVSLLVHRQPAARRPRKGITFLLAGGPGQSATAAFAGSILFEDERYEEWGSVTPRNDVVVFDQRGTGSSGLLRCRDLQASDPIDAARPAQACATVLGRRRAFYRTTDTVADMEAIRRALRAPRVTIVGVSYGTYVAQRYAMAHPDRVQRLVLDSVVDPAGVDPLLPNSFAAARRIIGELCRAGCRGFTSDPVADTAELVGRLAQAPLRGTVVRPSGRRVPASLSRQELAFLLGTGDLASFLRLEYPGAVVAALRGDSAPLLRMRRRSAVVESWGSPRDLSAAVTAATLCEEVRFPWPRSAPFAERPPRAFAAADAMAPALAPFDSWTAAGNDLIRLCRRWPVASPEEPAAAAPLPDVPVLMLAGGADMRTPVETAQGAAARYPRAQLLVAPDLGHSLLSEDDACVDRAVERFIRSRRVPSRCPRAAASRPQPPPPVSLRQLRPLPGASGVRGRALRALEMTIADATDELFLLLVERIEELLTGGGIPRGFRVPGLRGGSLAVELGGGSGRVRLRRLEFVPGVRVTGVLQGEEGVGRARLRLSGPGTPDGVLRADGRRLSGRLGGRPVEVRLRPDFGRGELDFGTGSSARRARVLRAARARGPLGGLALIMGR